MAPDPDVADPTCIEGWRFGKTPSLFLSQHVHHFSPPHGKYDHLRIFIRNARAKTKVNVPPAIVNSPRFFFGGRAARSPLPEAWSRVSPTAGVQEVHTKFPPGAVVAVYCYLRNDGNKDVAKW